MTTTIQKWGNSLAVRLPKEVVHARALHEGSDVVIETDNNRIIITPAPKKKHHLKLSSLIHNIHKKNIHTEHDWSNSLGNEVW